MLEAIGPMVVDTPHPWAARFKDALTSTVGFHGPSLIVTNARYLLVNLLWFFQVLAMDLIIG